ncbi:MAG: helix-hairpin-helix domain-containing protein [Pseudomonadota bacterium]
MMQLVEANWVAIVLALVIGLLVAYWAFSRGKPAARSHRPDVLDEGAAPAQRNQALIDAPPASVFASASGNNAEVIAAAMEQEAFAAGGAEMPTIAQRHADDLTRIKGIGPKLSTLLASLGVTSYAQIAAWEEEDLARVDAQLGTFAGRPVRDQWIAQARFLAAGDTPGYEGTFGKL